MAVKWDLDTIRTPNVKFNTHQSGDNSRSKSPQSVARCGALLAEALTTLTHHDKTFKSLLISPASLPAPECALGRTCVCVGFT